ncbi:3-oxoacyl-ACP reductase [Sinomonas cellulolyticus]|uniref:SDR family oxidoreductase n=1 Tax=Sinomonas cellulolyticus TaxID=2801916 RepID=A0ABS1K0X5_9MICC|nr:MULTISPECIES: SDR family oxidoreductase [Sinomonas]MBL0705118.1 SDR family oxidoreductase [Sinomonas cellulolyticus]GHG60821.1 3-oxoacyl-ACP reductase [Sinomonas sp. KCTC 49339]
MSDESHILVSGATGVVGAAVTRYLLRRGHRVIASYAHSASAAEALQSAARPDCLETIRADLTDPHGIAGLIDELDAREIRVAGFVHAAALVDHTATVDLEPVRFAEVLAVNVTAAYALARALSTRRILKSVVLLSSIGSEFAGLGSVAYTTSKGAVDALTRSLASELAPVRVNAVAPGVVRSHRTSEEPIFSSSEFTSRIPLGDLVDPIALSEVVAFLLGPEARAMTGQIVRVDGGHSLRLL